MQQPAIAYLEENYPHYLTEIQELLSIPSISSDENHAADMQQAADWIAGRLRHAGIEQVEIFSESGHSRSLREITACR